MKIQVKIDQHTYTVEVGDLNARPIRASVDGETFEVWPGEAAAPLPAVRPPLPASPPPAAPPYRAAAGGYAGVTAPIPGTIISVAVQPGDPVVPGQELLVLEAMKMKNLIRATYATTIASVAVQPGERVTQGQRLVEFVQGN